MAAILADPPSGVVGLASGSPCLLSHAILIRVSVTHFFVKVIDGPCRRISSSIAARIADLLAARRSVSSHLLATSRHRVARLCGTGHARYRDRASRRRDVIPRRAQEATPQPGGGPQPAPKRPTPGQHHPGQARLAALVRKWGRWGGYRIVVGGPPLAAGIARVHLRSATQARSKPSSSTANAWSPIGLPT